MQNDLVTTAATALAGLLATVAAATTAFKSVSHFDE